MPRLSLHNRNHSFPPSITYTQKPSKSLNKPLPDINDEPFLHFLANIDEDDRDADYLHFDAGILVGSESYKRKANKFRPISNHKRENAIHHHHGSFARRDGEHGFVRTRNEEYARAPERHTMTISQPGNTRQPRHRSQRPHSGHRHSWQEPSLDLFTVAEEVPQIVISDYDDLSALEPLSPAMTESDELHFAEPVADEDIKTYTMSSGSDIAGSPRLGAYEPAEKPDTQLNQMWFGERARL